MCPGSCWKQRRQSLRRLGSGLRLLALSLLLLRGVPVRPLNAQSPAAPAPAPVVAQPYVLHVYENLVQVPTLVLTTTHESYRGLRPDKFFIQLDGGPRFHPREVHLEGDDPISMAVLLDAGPGEQGALLQRAAAVLNRAAASTFTNRDQLSVFAFNCSLVHAALNQPASIPGLSTSVSEVLGAAQLHSAPGGGHCRQPLHLWDAMAVVVGELSQQPGRRVLVVISDGQDRGSKNASAALTQYATGNSVTVFGIRPTPPPVPVLGSGLPGPLLQETALNSAFGGICGGTGGMLLGSDPSSLAGDFERVLRLLRARYILEFPRFRNGSNGVHEIDVSTADFGAIVRTGGVSVPLEDKALENDPTTVHSDTSQNPTLGQGRKGRKYKP